ncbi:hypothetical protein [Krasilnikovia sp. MM14-A1004]|uniref:hypothetical protein n=1 Tax=Krasilnikovia sp. MM14-A1004 TaxID=3373541 RepID=UPI00399CBAEE
MDAELERALKQLREQASTHVGRWSSRTPIRTALYHLSRGRIDKRPRYTLGELPRLNSPWQDTDSGRYFRWRCRQANLHGDEAFVVEYIVCPHCAIGWVDRPYTDERYQRHGLAAAGFRALRAEHPKVRAWYAASGHMPDSKAFWAAVGAGIPGGYASQELCLHVAHDGGLLPGWAVKRPSRR